MIFRLGSFLLLLAVSFVVGGLLFRWAERIPFLSWMGRLPGDIRIEGQRTRLLIPFTTCLVISLALMVLLRVLRLVVPRL